MDKLTKIEQDMEIAKSAIMILLEHLREHEAKLNLLADNVIAMKDGQLTKLNGPN